MYGGELLFLQIWRNQSVHLRNLLLPHVYLEFKSYMHLSYREKDNNTLNQTAWQALQRKNQEVQLRNFPRNFKISSSTFEFPWVLLSVQV